MANKRIKDLATTKYKGFMALDNADGTGKMDVDTIFNNFAPEFVPSDRPNPTTTVTGLPYMYNGSLYMAKEAYQGPWDASKFEQITIKDILSKAQTIDDAEVDNYYFVGGDFVASAAWTRFTFKNPRSNFFKVYAKVGSIVGNYGAIVFLDSGKNVISYVKFVSENVAVEKTADVPENCAYICVCNRTDTYGTPAAFVYAKDIDKALDFLRENIKATDERFLATNINSASVDNYYLNGSEVWTASSSWERFKFNNIGYKKIVATAASNTANFGMVVFCDSSNAIIQKVKYGVADTSVTKEIDVPSGCVYIYVCNRTATYGTPSANLYVKNLESVIEYADANDSRIKDDIKGASLSATETDAVSVDPYYFSSGAFTKDTSFNRYIFENKGYSEIHVKVKGAASGHGAIVFLNEDFSIVSSVNYGTTSIVEKTDSIPSCKYIAVINKADNSDFFVKIYAANLDSIFERLNTLTDVSGCIKFEQTKGDPAYYVSVGNIEKIAAHFKMGMVKDGVLKYWLDQTNILSDSNGLFDSVLDGTDGDMLIVNDVPVYMLCGGNGVYRYRLFSLTPFSFDGLQAEKIECRGEAPSLCFVDNINDVNSSEHEANLGEGKTHYVRNANNVAYHSGMTGLVGKYIPSEVGGVITYTYDSSKSLFDSGAYLPTVFLNLSTAENAAMNKNAEGAVYTNMDLLCLDVVLALVEAECKTNYVNAQDLFGNGFNGGSSSTVPTADLFGSGMAAINGVRFKDASDNWVYARLNEHPLSNATDFFVMLTDWMTPWEIMEQHLVLSYAKTNYIAENTWFVYNGNEYKYTNVGTLKGLADGVMTANLFKKFRTKLGDVSYSGSSVAGNDIEFVILSSIYRGWVLDVCPHRWLTGINYTVDDDYNYKLFMTHNYDKYLMNKNYSEESAVTIFDFEKQYDFISSIRDTVGGHFVQTSAEKSACSVKAKGGSITGYECGYVYSDMAVAASGKKKVLGVKLGYGAYTEYCSRLMFYIQHPRTYYSAKAGYSSFVCQNVKV